MCSPSILGTEQLDRERTKIEFANKTPGSLEGLNCPECMNRGYFLTVDEQGYRVSRECRCMVRRKNRARIQKSGLEPMVARCTFDSWDATEPWRARAKEIAQRYAEGLEGWFLASGASGAGKTHLCTAICGRFMERGLDTLYMLWRSVSVDAKAAVNDREAYQRIVAPLKKAHVLYIDDLFKTGRGAAPSPGDFNLAFEVLNERYNDPRKLTIISTELSVDDLLSLDEAVGGRIYERSKGFYLDFRGRENWRLR